MNMLKSCFNTGGREGGEWRRESGEREGGRGDLKNVHMCECVHTNILGYYHDELLEVRACLLNVVDVHPDLNQL